MSAFISSFIGYIIKMICLVALGVCGGYVGWRIRKNKTAKEAEGE